MKSKLVTLTLTVEIKYDNVKTRDWILTRLPQELNLDIAGAGVDGGYSMKLLSTAIRTPDIIKL